MWKISFLFLKNVENSFKILKMWQIVLKMWKIYLLHYNILYIKLQYYYLHIFYILKIFFDRMCKVKKCGKVGKVGYKDRNYI